MICIGGKRTLGVLILQQCAILIFLADPLCHERADFVDGEGLGDAWRGHGGGGQKHGKSGSEHDRLQKAKSMRRASYANDLRVNHYAPQAVSFLRQR